jgi:diaminopimelate decarboxylase
LYVVQILYIKQTGQKNFAITNGGMHHNYLLAGGMGQVIRQNFEWEAISPNSNNTCPEYSLTITGKLCTPQDILIDNATCNQNLQPGDFIVFYNCGAYTLSASPQQFLSHPPANEYWIQS